jgi:diaminopimelate epimerase
MEITFYKYQGTGNDFIMIDNRDHSVVLSEEQVAALCHRRFGIGADGLILLESEPGFDFRMVYYNSDGRPGSMCGNGGRCITAFASQLGIISGKARFVAPDGAHEAMVEEQGLVSLKMQDVKHFEAGEDYFFLDTGSPHYVKLTDSLEELDVYAEGRQIRNSERFREEGTNVNFVQKENDGIFVRTYERGVEDETYSCGTGVTAAALVAAVTGVASARNHCQIRTRGGLLEVSFDRVLEQNFYNIWLKGPALYVYRGTVNPAEDLKRP